MTFTKPKLLPYPWWCTYSFLWLIIQAASTAFIATYAPTLTWAQDILPYDQAFRPSLQKINPTTLQVQFAITKGYYLYRDKLTVVSQTPGISVNTVNIPPGIQKYDPVFKKTLRIFRDQLTLTTRLDQPITHSFTLQVTSQGCSDSGLCYPPRTQVLNLGSNPVSGSTSFSSTTPLTLLSLFGIGLLLAFTPCMLPMLPILASVLLPDEHREEPSRRQAFRASSLYALGVIFTYALLGSLAAYFGYGLGTLIQTPWVATLLAGFTFVFALMMFDVFHFKFTQRWVHALHTWSNQQLHQHPFSLVAAGAVSGLLASACVGPVLAGTLLYIAQSQSLLPLLEGGLSLAVMALGMMLPLVVGATFGLHYLPNTGSWMRTIKRVLGMGLLGLSVWIVHPQLPQIKWFSHLLQSNSTNTHFIDIENVDDLRTYLNKEQPVMLEVYASWCLECQRMKITTFRNPQVQKALANITMLRLDLTKHHANKQALTKHLGIFGPPTFLFFDATGQEAPSTRIVGYANAPTFIKRLHTITTTATTAATTTTALPTP